MTEELFSSVIESIKEQVIYDQSYARTLSALLSSEVQVYNNSVLINSLKNVIAFNFPSSVQVEVLSEIDHYCFFQNFGRIDTGEEIVIESSSEFYERLKETYV